MENLYIEFNIFMYNKMHLYNSILYSKYEYIGDQTTVICSCSVKRTYIVKMKYTKL